VVVGGSAAAAWKVELLSAAGAHVDVFATELADEVVAAAQGVDVTLHRRAIEDRILQAAVLAIGAFDDEAPAAEFAATRAGGGRRGQRGLDGRP